MVDNGIKLLVIPPGGWKFEQTIENGSPYLISAQTYPLLENKVFDFRVSNVEIIPSGTASRESVREDLQQWICSQFPTQCTGYVPTQPIERTRPVYATPISRLDDWFKRVAIANLSWKEPAKAALHAQICSTCPQNIEWQTGCAPCVESVKRKLARYKGDRNHPLDSQLKSCRCFGHHNELAVWLNDTLSTPREPPPSICWNK